MKTLRKEARAREEKVVREVLQSRNVVLCTCVGAATFSLRDEQFDLVVIDEAAQASDGIERARCEAFPAVVVNPTLVEIISRTTVVYGTW